jgi:ABC-type Fe3+-hydroxamate transport system substrate-binding protein
MFVFTDQTGRKITLETTPRRIISVVPSQTELLFDLGLREEVIGITKFCVHPEQWFRNKTKVGGTKQLKIELIHQLLPDLIIANKEENTKEQIEELEKYYPVWISNINNLDNAYEMIEQVGLITTKEIQANKIVAGIKENFAQFLRKDSSGQTSNLKLQTCYLIWQKPYMTVGGDTFIHSMMKAAGFENIFAKEKRYPETTIEELRNLRCELLLLSSEPFPFKQRHAEEIQSLLPNIKILLVDGEMFSWYGSRLLKATDYFRQLQLKL